MLNYTKDLEKIGVIEKITKKEYYNLIKNTLHYNIGSVYLKHNKEFSLSSAELINKLNETFFNLEFLYKNCLLCLNCNKNSVDFLHLDYKDNRILHEQKKGSFYIIELKNLFLVIHEYKDRTQTITFKIVVKSTNIKL